MSLRIAAELFGTYRINFVYSSEQPLATEYHEGWSNAVIFVELKEAESLFHFFVKCLFHVLIAK